MSDKKIWLSSPHMGGEEIKFVMEAFETNWISPVGPHIDEFEKELATYCAVPNCVVLSSGTAAIHLALIILGVKQGDEILCSSFTFSGSCNPIAYVGATAVFVDSERTSWNMDPELLEEAILDRIKKGKKPKALILVHLYGSASQVDKIMEISNRYEIPVIEDAAEALGATYRGKHLGSFGHFGVFSFNGNKIITTSGGGALVSQNKEWIRQAKFLSTQARDAAPHYQHSTIGYNYRLSNVLAGIGRGQLRVLDQRVQERRRIFEFYKQALAKYPFISFQQELEDSRSNRWLTTIVVDGSSVNREDLRLALEKENIESRPLWKPMHLQPVFENSPAYVNGVSEELFDKGLCLPSGTNMTEHDMHRVISAVNRVLA
jgi:dTDP-4-amino-4,6-dideoxygalactose transaminase